jgi:hypothetical protein
MYTRLTRETPWKAQVGCGAVMALMVALPGLIIGYMTWFHDHSDSRNGMFVFAGVWVGVGVLILIGSIHQAFALRSPETIVEIEPSELRAGQSVRVRITQPGPLRLQSIHANLAGEQTTIRLVPRTGKTSRTTKYLGPYRILEIDDHEIAPGESVDRDATFQVPDVVPSYESPDGNLRWKIEVWGRVAWRADFMHPFPVTIAAAKAEEIR